MLVCPLLRIGAGPGGQFSCQHDDPVGQQVVGVLDRAPAQDVGGVQNDLESASPEVARMTREVQALLEDRPHPLVDDQARPKQLQRALGERPLPEADSQRDFPAQVEVRSRLGFLVGDTLVGLQEQRRRQQARRDARTPVVQAIQVGEVLLTEQLFAVQSEEAVEGVPSDVIEVGMVAAVWIRLPPEHRKCLLVVFRQEECTQTVSSGLFGHASSLSLYRRALDLQTRCRYGFYDSLVIAAALDSGCTRLYSGVLQLAHAFEQATGFGKRRPPIVA